MAAYLAWRIEGGNLSYKQVMSVPLLRQFKEDIDMILYLDGYDHLIEEVSEVIKWQMIF